MDEIVVKDSSQLDKKDSPRIGNIVFNYKGYDKPIHATPIVMENGEIVILTNMRASAGRSRVVLQDLSGNEIKSLLKLGYENAEVTKDDEKIYIATSNSHDPQFYTFDLETFTQTSKKPLGRSRIQSLCCDKENIYSFDMESGKVQTRDKQGNIISDYDIRKQKGPVMMTSDQYMYVTSTGVNFAGIDDIRINDEYIKQLEQKFGKEFMDLNRNQYNPYEDIAYDEKKQTMYIATRNLVYVVDSQEIKGVMYFPDKSIMGLDLDPATQSLMISAGNWPESEQCISFDKGGSLEILPIDMVNTRIKESMEFLEARYKRERMKKIGHDIVDLSDGDFECMTYLLGKAKEMGDKVLPIIDELIDSRVPPEQMITTAESYFEQTKKMLPDNNSPLKEREDELSGLEKEAKTISEAERLIEQQNEKDIRSGEE